MLEQEDISNEARELLLVPKGFIGDFILMSPVFRALKESNPSRRLVLLAPVGLGSYAAKSQFIDEVITFDRRRDYKGLWGLFRFARMMRERKFESVCSFHMSVRTSILLLLSRIPRRIGYSGAMSSLLYTQRIKKNEEQHEVLRNVSLIEDLISQPWSKRLERAVSSVANDISLEVPEVVNGDVSERVRAVCSSPKGYVILAPGSAWKTKQWTSDGFRSLAEQLSTRGDRVVVVGAGGDAHTASLVSEGQDVVNFCGETSLAELTYLIQHARGVVCNDSLALHIASAVKTPSVVIFCATSPRFGFGPWNTRSIVLEKGQLFCKPCRRHGSNRCPIGSMACSAGVSSDMVLKALDDVMAPDREDGIEMRIV